MPRDGHGRIIDYLRISVMDKCNLRCSYCMPLEGLKFLPEEKLLTASEIALVTEAAVACGFRKFRITGGSPRSARISVRSLKECAGSLPRRILP